MLDSGRGHGPEKEKKLPDMKVVMEAWRLEEHSLVVTSSASHFPKKYRFSLCREIQSTALAISGSLLEANEIDLRKTESRRERAHYQNVAMRKCKIILHYIELSRRMKIISDDSFAHWARMANNVKNMCAKWQMSDIERAKHFDAQKGDTL
jgi:hypothetical protein